MDIKHPRRLLVIGGTDLGALDVIKDLTGSTPPLPDTGSTAGLTHEWSVETAYYKTKVPIWVDEISDLKDWKSEFLKPEAKEVVDAVGAWVYCFRTSVGEGPNKEAQETMRAIQQICEEHVGYNSGTESVMLAVATHSSQASNGDGNYKGVAAEDWEDACLEHGFEYIDYRAKGKNEFGEKMGFERLKEALEANEWAARIQPDTEPGFDDLDAFDHDVEDAFTRRDEAEMTAELFGMKAALAGIDSDDLQDENEDGRVNMGVADDEQKTQVEDLDRLMGKLMAVKEQSAELPEAQRRRMAAKAVREVMGSGGGQG